MKKDKPCSKCGQEKRIVNRFFYLCHICNQERLKNKSDTLYSGTEKMQHSISGLSVVLKGERISFSDIQVNKKTASSEIKKDEEFYEKCFNNSDHKCEECSMVLPDTFRDDNNKVVARWRYSHIIPKSIAPWLRRNIKNINHLCLKCHSKWENGDKKSMKIYTKNARLFPNFLND